MSDKFNMGSLADWRELGQGEILSFPVGGSDFRSVMIEFCTDDVVSIMAGFGEKTVLVGCGVGRIDVAFTTPADTAVQVVGQAGVTVFYKTFCEPQVVPNSREPSFTRIEPRVVSPEQELIRVARKLLINSDFRHQTEMAERQRAHKAELAALRAARPAPVEEVVEDVKD